MLAVLKSRLVSLIYSIAIHSLAFWMALFAAALLGGKSPNLVFVLVPVFLGAYFTAGWISQQRLHENRIAYVVTASILSFLLLPLIVFLNRDESEIVEPANWLAMLWVLPCVASSIAGMFTSRYNARSHAVSVDSVHKP